MTWTGTYKEREGLGDQRRLGDTQSEGEMKTAGAK